MTEEQAERVIELLQNIDSKLDDIRSETSYIYEVKNAVENLG